MKHEELQGYGPYNGVRGWWRKLEMDDARECEIEDAILLLSQNGYPLYDKAKVDALDKQIAPTATPLKDMVDLPDVVMWDIDEE